jgi:FkbM family methyltransferase
VYCGVEKKSVCVVCVCVLLLCFVRVTTKKKKRNNYLSINMLRQKTKVNHMRPYIHVLLLCLILWTTNAERFSKLFDSRMQELALACHTSGIEVKSIVDVGANTGDFTRLMIRLFPEASVHMVEANKELAKTLKLVGKPFDIALVGDKEKEIQFHVHKDAHTGGSIYREHRYKYRRPENINVNTVPMTTIDKILDARGIQHVDVLKLDIQGAEYLALRGAKTCLRSAQIVISEAPIMQYNPGSPSFTDVNILLELNGFRLYDIIDLRHMPLARAGADNQTLHRTLVQFDAIWAKTDSKLFTDVDFPAFPPGRYQFTEKKESKKKKRWWFS